MKQDIQHILIGLAGTVAIIFMVAILIKFPIIIFTVTFGIILVKIVSALRRFGNFVTDAYRDIKAGR